MHLLATLGRKTNSHWVYSVLAYWASLIVVQTLFRVALVLYFKQHVHSVDCLPIFTTGLRFDISTASWLAALAMLCLYTLPAAMGPRVFFGLAITGIATTGFLEITAFAFMQEYGLRPNRLMFEYLSSPVEIFATIWQTEKLAILNTVLGVGLVAWYGFRGWKYFLPKVKSPSPQYRLFQGFALAIFFFFCGRGNFISRPINAGTAAFSNNPLLNELAINSAFSLGSAINALRFEEDATAIYTLSVKEEDVFPITKQAAYVPAQDFIKDHNPLMHQVLPRQERPRGLNLVIILEESLGAEFVGSLHGKPLTPCFDKLSETGLFFEHLYATGTRSARGIEAVISGFPPTPGKSIIKLGLSQHNFFTVAKMLGTYGYKTSFIYGGNSGFDNMRTFALNNGFQQIFDQRDYMHPQFVGTWGVSDEDLFAMADSWFNDSDEHGPFFSLVFTSSNHGPFEFPDGRIDLYEQPKNTVHNAVKYADYALGNFFDTARRRNYFDHTIFLIVADHNWKTFGEDLVPIEKMQIPGLIIGPDVAPQHYHKPASQIDLVPTVLPYLGIPLESPMIGHDVMSLPDKFSGRAILQYDQYHAYMVGDQVITHSPHAGPQEWVFRGGRLHAINAQTRNNDLIKESEAYILLPTLLYRQRVYSFTRPSRQTNF